MLVLLLEEHTDTSQQDDGYQSNGRIMRLTLLPIFVNRILHDLLLPSIDDFMLEAKLVLCFDQNLTRLKNKFKYKFWTPGLKSIEKI